MCARLPMVAGSLAALVVLAAACGGIVRGSGVIETQRYAYDGLSRVVVSNGFSLDLFYSSHDSVTIRIDRSLKKYLVVTRKGTTLSIGLRPGNSYRGTSAIALVGISQLQSLDVQGSSEATVSGFSESALRLSVSGSSKLTLQGLVLEATGVSLSGTSSVAGGVTTHRMRLRLSGASTSTLVGSADSLRIEAAGASHAFMPDVLAFTLRASLSGGSVATVHVVDRLDATLGGGSSLKYLGEPVIGTVTRTADSQLSPVGL